ncbi:MAG: SMP-30/gluconolactonase/LRE family protein [Deltaproteobacteria bacterium]|nr:SMP-30/gluconolactonase/LRE family protein [Deltaproteobacteria bacterium]
MPNATIIDIQKQDIVVIPTQCQLGEGIQWNIQDQKLYWTDILGHKMYRCRIDGSELEEMSFAKRLCSFAFIKQSEAIFCAFESHCAEIYFGTEIQDNMIHIEMPAGVRLNDGRCDRQGRFWVGSMGEGSLTKDRVGELYLINKGSYQAMLGKIGISNGLSWSIDGKTMYFADSLLGEIYTYAFDTTTGQISDKNLFARVPDGGSPDGSVVDHQNYIWNAQWGISRIARYSPDGKEDCVIALPVSQPSCLCFCGPDLQHVAVTSAWDGLHPDRVTSYDGSVLIFKTDFMGLPEELYCLR